MYFLKALALSLLAFVSQHLNISIAENKIVVEKVSSDQTESLYSVAVTVPLNEALSLIELEESAAKIARQAVLKEIGQELTHETTIVNDRVLQDKITGYRHVISKIDRTNRSFAKKSVLYTFNVSTANKINTNKLNEMKFDRVKHVNVNQTLKNRVHELEEENRQLKNSHKNIIEEKVQLETDSYLELGAYTYNHPLTHVLVDLVMKHFDIKSVSHKFDNIVIDFQGIPTKVLTNEFKGRGLPMSFRHTSGIKNFDPVQIFKADGSTKSYFNPTKSIGYNLTSIYDKKDYSYSNNTYQFIHFPNNIKSDTLLVDLCIGEDKCSYSLEVATLAKSNHGNFISVSSFLRDDLGLKEIRRRDYPKGFKAEVTLSVCPSHKAKIYEYECHPFLIRQIDAAL